MGVIYCLTSPSGKQYIGQTKRAFIKRLNEHKKCISGCIILNNAIQKYGFDSFTYEVLVETNNLFLNNYEKDFINMFNTMEPNGYNVRSGGSQCSTHSIESRNRMSLAKRGTKNHNYGKERSADTKLKISQARSGEKHHFYGKSLSYEHKLKLSNSHKSDISLPMYMIYVKPRPIMYQSEGYAILNHPTLKNKYFTTKRMTLEEKYNLAFNYLNS